MKFDSPKAERAVNSLKRRGYEIDEIETMCNTEEDLFKLLHNVLKSESKTEEAEEAAAKEDDEEEAEPEDDYRLPEHEAANLLGEESAVVVRESNKRFEEDPSVVKDEEGKPVADFDDFLKSLDEGMSADDSNVPNN